MGLSGILVGGIALSILMTIGFYATNVRFRSAVDDAVRPLKVPERRARYSAEDLAQFREVASGRPTPLGMSALTLYRRRVLLIDCGFAVGLGVLSTLCWFAAGPYLPSSYQWIVWIGYFWSIGYAFFDVAEDLMLRTLLNTERAIDKNSANRATTATLMKLVFITLSLVGLVVWLLLNALEKWGLFKKFKPNDPAG